MKRIGIILSIVIVIAAVFIFVNKSYYPSLPVDSLSARETIEKLNKSDEKIVEIAKDDKSIWYITKNEEDGILTVDENIKKMISTKGWEFKDKMGSGLFFEKDDEQLTVTTQMWTKKYVLIQVQNQFKEA
ncbi:hypothetical protein DV702_15340 [Sporosarcina sp. PTS2304]|uniref:hypothetical protein n=1 Tax=Sporosarcina sp. PTS2304 TaxID=2283194 RepID=UPI000E0CDDD5|nr:hypothetical protein [Sporosarcina sp. PTS2304]AXI00962.1 hypothetical protein DV702_15340 [Sporosarcina sp. PTS2304]